MAQQEDLELNHIVKNLPDLSYEVTAKNMPSVLISSPDDPRINNLARTKTKAFIVKSEASDSFLVIVNPHLSTGFLWWKNFDRLVFRGERLRELQDGTIRFTSPEKSFILSVK